MSNDLKSKFDELFKVYYPATFEQAARYETKAYRDMSNAWWGFQQGYGCALPTTEPVRPKSKVSYLPIFMFVAALIGAVAGYNFPRDLEIESTKPIKFTYEISHDAAKFLLLRDGPKCEVQP